MKIETIFWKDRATGVGYSCDLVRDDGTGEEEVFVDLPKKKPARAKPKKPLSARRKKKP
jgi:hypothetical protein